MSVKNNEAGDKQSNLHQAKTEGTKYQAKAKGGVKNEGIDVSQLEDKQNKKITIEEAKVKKDQERDERKITIEKAKESNNMAISSGDESNPNICIAIMPGCLLGDCMKVIMRFS